MLAPDLGKFSDRGNCRIRGEAEAWLRNLKLEGRDILNKSTFVMVSRVADVGYTGHAAPPNIDRYGGTRRRPGYRAVLNAVPVRCPVENGDAP